MKLKEMIELVKEAHPDITDNRIIKLLNQANREFSNDSRVSDASYIVSGGTVVDQTYYTIDTEIIAIEDVYINKERAQRLGYKPDKEDEDLTSWRKIDSDTGQINYKKLGIILLIMLLFSIMIMLKQVEVMKCLKVL